MIKTAATIKLINTFLLNTKKSTANASKTTADVISDSVATNFFLFMFN